MILIVQFLKSKVKYIYVSMYVCMYVCMYV